jgi:hypothetical protein
MRAWKGEEQRQGEKRKIEARGARLGRERERERYIRTRDD